MQLWFSPCSLTSSLEVELTQVLPTDNCRFYPGVLVLKGDVLLASLLCENYRWARLTACALWA